MKQLTAGLVFLAALTSASGLLAAGPDETLCRGGYPVLLMTPQECRQHVRRVKSLQARGQTEALHTLQRQHAQLLQERATVCPCMEGQPQPGPTLLIARAETDC
ncbi:MAG: hypothetical protein WAK92_08030 [Thiobacillus sp.]